MLAQIKEFLAGSQNGAAPSTNLIETSIREISLTQLQIDHSYQREVNSTFVAYLVEHWNPEAVGLLRVAERAGLPFIVDGQHRFEAMKQLGMTHALCHVAQSGDAAQEARAFLDTNKHRPVQLIYIFRALLKVGDAEAVAINDLAKRAGWQINTNLASLARAGETCAVATLEELYRRDAVTLELALRLLLQVWPTEPRIGISKVIRGGFLFVRYGGNQIKPARLRRVADVPLSAVLRRAEGLAVEQDLSPAMAFARQMAVEYNRGAKAEHRVTFDQAE